MKLPISRLCRHNGDYFREADIRELIGSRCVTRRFRVNRETVWLDAGLSVLVNINGAKDSEGIAPLRMASIRTPCCIAE